MTDQTRERVIFLGGLMALISLIVGSAILIEQHSKKAPSYTTKIVDRDTGEVIVSQPNNTPEAAAGGNIPLFGAQQVFDGGATQAQFKLVQHSLNIYSSAVLRSQYQTLTFVPSSFKAQTGVLTGKLRLGQSNNLVDFRITLSQLKYVRVVITDSAGQNGGNYDSGQLTVPVQGGE